VTAEARALIAEGKHHDEAMQWAQIFSVVIQVQGDGDDATGIAWLRTNLAALLTGYAVALDALDAAEARLETKDAVIAAGLRTINSGDEALHALRVQFAADRDKLQAELHDARAKEPRP